MTSYKDEALTVREVFTNGPVSIVDCTVTGGDTDNHLHAINIRPNPESTMMFCDGLDSTSARGGLNVLRVNGKVSEHVIMINSKCHGPSHGKLFRSYGKSTHVIVDTCTIDDSEGNSAGYGHKSLTIASHSHIPEDWVDFGEVHKVNTNYGRAGFFFQAVSKLSVKHCTFNNFGKYLHNGEESLFVQDRFPNKPPNYKIDSGGQCIKVDNNVQNREVDYLFEGIVTTNTNPINSHDFSPYSSRNHIYNAIIIEDGGPQQGIRFVGCDFDTEVRHRGTASGGYFKDCIFRDTATAVTKNAIFDSCTWEASRKPFLYAVGPNRFINCQFNGRTANNPWNHEIIIQ